MYRASPDVPLISPYKGLSPSLIFTTFSILYLPFFPPRSLSHTHMHTLLSFIPPYALVSSGCNELSTLAYRAVTEVFIKHRAICQMPRTGKSHSSEAARWNRGEGKLKLVMLQLEFGYTAALNDRYCCELFPCLQTFLQKSDWTLEKKGPCCSKNFCT